MSLFDRSALNDGVSPREVFAWSLYDFANSGYTTVVLTAVFNAYFVGVVAGGAVWATFVWTLALSVSSFAVMLTAPAIGAWADGHGTKKLLLAISTIACVVATAGLYFTNAGTIALAIVLVIVSNYAYSIGETLIAAFLPELAKPESLGRVSGWGWSFGYLGGMLTLGLSLAWVINAQSTGQSASQFVPVTMLITAAIFALAATPMFIMLGERRVGQTGAIALSANTGVQGLVATIGDSLAQLRRNWHEAKAFADFYRFLLCAVSYQAGIAVVVALAAIYAEQTMGFTQSQTMMLILLVNIAAAGGAFVFGYVQDRIGHLRALAVTLVGWIIMVFAGRLRHVGRRFLAGCRLCRTVHGLEPVGGPSTGRSARPHGAPRGVLWPMGFRDPAVRRDRTDHLRCGHLADRGQSSAGDSDDRAFLRRRAAAAGRPRYRSRSTGRVGGRRGIALTGRPTGRKVARAVTSAGRREDSSREIRPGRPGRGQAPARR